jgi:hypothetical protein
VTVACKQGTKSKGGALLAVLLLQNWSLQVCESSINPDIIPTSYENSSSPPEVDH